LMDNSHFLFPPISYLAFAINNVTAIETWNRFATLGDTSCILQNSCQQSEYLAFPCYKARSSRCINSLSTWSNFQLYN